MRTVKDLVRRLPDLQEATMRWVDQYERGSITLQMDTSELNQRVEATNRGLGWLTIALLLGGMAGGSAIAVGISADIGGVPLPLIAFGLFVVSMLLSAVLATRLIWTVWLQN